ncbi:MAG: 5-oxoprolinase subunit PxpB [Melioribacteraceae bacterium]
MREQQLNKYPDIQFANDRSLLIKVGKEISRENHEKVHKIFLLLNSSKIEGIQSIHPAYNSILITFDPCIISPHRINEIITSLFEQENSVTIPESRIITIPVCYEDEYALDISNVAKQNSLTIDQVIQFHSQPEYLVYFLGFSPGFPYLGEMPKEIATPRLASPRLKVPEGSVAIGGDQTGIYPLSSPGGWNIIGRTPLKLFSPDKEEPTLLRMGDKVKFVPITKKEFQQLKN